MDIETLAIAFVLLIIFSSLVADIVRRIRRRSWRDFGLVELLVVITVVGVIVAFFLPSVHVE